MYVVRHRVRFIKTDRCRLLDNFQNEIFEMDATLESMKEGVESGRGRRFIRWSFDKRLGANDTPSVLAKFRESTN